MKLYNLMEDEVSQVIDKVLKEIDSICKCDVCILDIAAISLNNLKPNYVVTEQGYVFAKANNLNQQFNTDVVATVTKAIDIVGKNPRHKK